MGFYEDTVPNLKPHVIVAELFKKQKDKGERQRKKSDKKGKKKKEKKKKKKEKNHYKTRACTLLCPPPFHCRIVY
ncbi:hypothetical protein llap_15043 [Limosa lapponica baueri]|uniref:Uncharacterized protein n=1 Tax=Limosa lapponica baueri TaxID=1758121 RepID=A0A2I0TLP9_LIMLA|nr:hypothetical protein llap_15043 [Limosa lapponica baueri]